MMARGPDSVSGDEKVVVGCKRVSQGKEHFNFFSLSTGVELL